MTHGKKVCKILKEIRRQIAEKNDIALLISECHFQGECKGTCPKCEAEVRHLENELNKRRQIGKAVAIAGIALGVAGILTDCKSSKQYQSPINEQEITIVRDRPLSDSVPYRFVDKIPEYPGGKTEMYKFISSNLVYPEDARIEGIQGAVIVEFIIERSGEISRIQVVSSLYPACDKEVLRVIQMMPNWIPGEKDGKLVPTLYQIPVQFLLK